MEEIVLALELKAQLDALRPISNDEEQRIMQKFRLDWNYHSNNLEGNSLTYGETKALILFNITAQGKPLKDHFEITGHNEAINWVIDLVNGDRPLTESFIRELHTLLLKESYEVDAITPDGKPTKKRINVGSYKSTPNHVQTKTGEIFRFATPEETPSKMADLMDWYNNKIEEENANAILIAAEFHYKFIRIHPFDDGNGRTARILMNFILMKFGYPPVIIKTEDKANYFAALQLADAGNIEAFINYIAQNLVHSLQIMIAGAQGENIEEPDDIDKEIVLLEKRLAGFGDKITPKSARALRSIYENNIKVCAYEISDKLSNFNDYYLNKNIYIEIDGKRENQYTIDSNVKTVKVIVDYNTIKIFGLENFQFTYEILFEFTPVKYNVYSIYSNIQTTLFIKGYNILDTNEITSIINNVVKEHNRILNKFIDKS